MSTTTPFPFRAYLHPGQSAMFEPVIVEYETALAAADKADGDDGYDGYDGYDEGRADGFAHALAWLLGVSEDTWAGYTLAEIDAEQAAREAPGVPVEDNEREER